MHGKERRNKPRPDHGAVRMTSSELDAAIKELNAKVQLLMAERQSRQRAEDQPDSNFSALKTAPVSSHMG